jgi:hypothetical protein
MREDKNLVKGGRSSWKEQLLVYTQTGELRRIVWNQTPSKQTFSIF